MTERVAFAPVSRRNLSDEVREALVGSIRSGVLTPGALLPSERSLSEEFGVARTSVREAIQSLLSLGQIHKQGNRFYIVEQLPDVTLEASDRRKNRVRELFEVRRVMEVAIARFAVQRASQSDLAELRAIADSFTPSMPLAEFRRCDRLFHWTVARACGNPTLQEVYGKVLDAVFGSEEFKSLLDSRSNVRAVRQVIRESSFAHQLIADAVLGRDETSAAEAAEAHIAQVESYMISRMV